MRKFETALRASQHPTRHVPAYLWCNSDDIGEGKDAGDGGEFSSG
jgi:hypothetical protein